MMVPYFSFILTFILPPLQVWGQTVQDDWTAPAAPDGSTPLQSGTKFTLLWKFGLQNNFKTYCPSCDTQKLDLCTPTSMGPNTPPRLAVSTASQCAHMHRRLTLRVGGIDVTTTTSYDWNVNVASDAFSGNDFWVFRFTFFDSADPYTQQISSPGFKISGLIKASSMVAVQSSSRYSSFCPTIVILNASLATTSSAQTSSSIATTSTNGSSSSFSIPQSTEQPLSPDSSSKSHTWISGVVLGPLAGLAMGAALMWFCLRKSKNEKAQRQQGSSASDQSMHHQDPKAGYSQTMTSDTQPWQQGRHDQYIAEAPGSIDQTPRQPAELWHGNYSSKP
jgi:hypothetical protein